MHRRRFLQSASLTAAAVAIAPLNACRNVTHPAYPMGYQLFSVRDVMATDPLATVAALTDMGYRHFEAYGYDAQSDRLYGMAPAELRARLTGLGTRLTSSHFGFADYLHRPDDELRRYTDRCARAAQALGLDYLVWPVMPEADRTPDGYRLLADRLNLIGEQLRGSGTPLAFHNNGGEFADLGDGTSGYDVVLAKADPDLVKLQLDMYWLRHDTSALTPAEVIARAPGRTHLWHVKDMHPVSRDYTELGAGTIDYAALLPSAGESGLVHLYLEQGGNFAQDSVTSARASATHWQSELARRVG